MKAIRYTEYGSPGVLHLVEVELPVPKDDEVLIRVHAASLNALDMHYMHGWPSLMRLVAGLRRPKETRLGVDVAGVVESVGANITKLKPGDEVFGVCRGAFAEYACAQEARIVMKPATVSFEEAAATPIAGVTALQGIRYTGQVQPGEKVLINGAGGGVGSFAVQIAKTLGAEVTAVTRTRNLKMVQAIGADHVIDYTREDFTKKGQRYDAIFDVGGTHPLRDLRRALTDEGRWLFAGAVTEGGLLGPMVELLKAAVQSPFSKQKVKMVSARATAENLLVMQEYLAAGKVAPVIDRTYPLREAAEAMRYLESGNVGGKVVVTVAD